MSRTTSVSEHVTRIRNASARRISSPERSPMKPSPSSPTLVKPILTSASGKKREASPTYSRFSAPGSPRSPDEKTRIARPTSPFRTPQRSRGNVEGIHSVVNTPFVNTASRGQSHARLGFDVSSGSIDDISGLEEKPEKSEGMNVHVQREEFINLKQKLLKATQLMIGVQTQVNGLVAENQELTSTLSELTSTSTDHSNHNSVLESRLDELEQSVIEQTSDNKALETRNNAQEVQNQKLEGLLKSMEDRLRKLELNSNNNNNNNNNNDPPTSPTNSNTATDPKYIEAMSECVMLREVCTQQQKDIVKLTSPLTSPTNSTRIVAPSFSRPLSVNAHSTSGLHRPHTSALISPSYISQPSNNNNANNNLMHLSNHHTSTTMNPESQPIMTSTQETISPRLASPPLDTTSEVGQSSELMQLDDMFNNLSDMLKSIQ